MIRFSFAIATLSALGITAGHAVDNLIKNGSFEKPVVSDGGGMFFSPGDTFTGWAVVGPGGNVGVDSDVNFCGHLFPAKKGAQWLDLTGNSDNGNPNGVEQTIKTSPGSTYTLTFYIGNVVDTGGQCGISSTVNVTVDGEALASVTNKGGKGDTQKWEKFSTQFVASAAHTTIAFTNGDQSGDADNGLDGISITLKN